MANLFSRQTGMKRGAVLLIIMAGLFARPVLAQTLEYKSFNADIIVNTDASINVTETITVDFLTAHHGIYRNIPWRYTTTDGGTASIPLDQFTVKQDNQAVAAETSKSGNDQVVKIGDPNKTISGTHVYTISYRAQAATNFFTDHDELYWNVTGENWDEPLHTVTATVHMPAAITSGVTVACYTGAYGSTATDCLKSASGNTATFSANTYLTAVVGWPTGIVMKPENYDDLRAKAVGASFGSAFSGWLLMANILTVVLVFVVMWLIWLKKGRDPKMKKTIIAQYDPPEGMRPAEVGVLLGQSADTQDMTATIVDLAVRGYIRIEEKEKEKFLGFGQKKDYELVELKKPDTQMAAYEYSLMNSLFRNPKVTAEGSRVKMSDFTKHKDAVKSFREVTKEMVKNMVDRGYFATSPTTARMIPVAIGMAFIWFGFQSVVMPGLALAGVIIIIFGVLMPKRTEKGVEAAWVAKGFKEYLQTAEKYRLQWQEREHIFEKFLPYAMVLGVAKHWSEVLAPYVKDAPDWYVGAPGAQFNAVLFYSSLNSFGTMINSSAVSGAASGSSGFSGGFSGGGGGGGGGGGW